MCRHGAKEVAFMNIETRFSFEASKQINSGCASYNMVNNATDELPGSTLENRHQWCSLSQKSIIMNGYKSQSKQKVCNRISDNYNVSLPFHLLPRKSSCIQKVQQL